METLLNMARLLSGYLYNIIANIYQDGLVWSFLGGEAVLLLATLISIGKRMAFRNHYTCNLLNDFSDWCLRNRSFSPVVVEEHLSLIVAKEEGWSSRVLDFCRVTSPLLGLAGTLIGLQHAFANAGQGKAAIESGLATALGTTYAGIILAILSFLIMKFLLQPYLDGLSAQLLQEFHRQKERLRRLKTEASKADGEINRKQLFKEGKIDEYIE